MGSVVQQDPGAPMAMPVYGYQSGGGSRWNQQYTQDQPFGYFGGGMNTLSWGPLAQSMNTMAGSGPGSLQGAMSQMWDVNRSNQAAAQANLDRQARLAAIDKIGGIMSRMMGGGGVGSGVQPYYDTMSRQRIL